MKRRDYKSSAFNSILHIYNRGNNREKIFHDDQDYRAFLFRLGLGLGFTQEELERCDLLHLPYSRIRIDVNNRDFKLHSFCLMPNHFHLLIEQHGNVPVSKLISKICTSYAMYLNKKYKRVGHVFQERFKSVVIENNPQLMWTSTYIHMNPVKDGLVRHPNEHKWSSYKDFAENRNLQIVEKGLLISTFGNKNNFIKETLNFNLKD